MKRKITIALILCLVFALAACSGNNKGEEPNNETNQVSTENNETKGNEETNEDSGPIVLGQTWVAGSLDPVDGGNPWSLTSHGVTEAVFMQNEKGELVSHFVKDMEQKDDLTWILNLKEDTFFSDGSPVDAKAFCAALNTVMEKNLFSDATAGKMAFTEKGEYAVEVKTERKTAAMDSVLAEWTNVVFKDLGNGEYAFTGPYVVKEIDPGVEIHLTPNEHYPNAEKRGDITVKAFKDVSAMKLAFESGEIDMAFTVTPEVAKMLKDEGKTIKTIDAGYQYFGIVNLKGIMGDKTLREAINLGIKREDYLNVLQGGKLPTGIFAAYNPFAGKVDVKEDMEAAKKLLDEGGYTLNDNGLREKDGKVLSINLVTYPSRPDLSLIMQVMVTQLKELGIEAKTSIVENIDAELQAGNFDLALYAQHTSPTGNPLFFFSQFIQSGGGKNNMGYRSEAVDAKLNEMANLPLGEENNKISQEVQQMIYDDLPLIYLVDPQWHVALSDRLADYTPYCGDYYIINDQLFVK